MLQTARGFAGRPVSPPAESDMLIVFEGIDGAGKNTQTGLLTQRVACEGMSSAVFSFPRYGLNPFARAIARYLNGEFGGLDAVAPELAALLYSGDRFSTRDEIQEALGEKSLVICDRYVSSNLAHQAAKLPHEKRDDFIQWLIEIEHDTYGLPRADLTFFLDVPVETSQQLMRDRGKRAYTEEQTDIHERAVDYLTECRDVFLHLAAHDICGTWHRIACTDARGAMRVPEEIGEEIWRAVRPLLLERAS